MKNEIRAGQQFNLGLFYSTGKMVVPSEDANFYKEQLKTGYQIEPVSHPQFTDYISFTISIKNN